MRVLVAGSTGVVGRLLLPKLVNTGHQVIGMTHKEENKEMIQALGARPLIIDAFDRDAVLSAVDEIRPDVIFHQLTSLSSRNFSDNTRIRMEGTRNLVDAALAAGVTRMIAQSICWAYEPGQSPAKEDEPLDLDSPMPRKLTIDGVAALEKAAAEMPIHVILRYGLFYGPGTWYDHHEFMAQKVLLGEVPANEGVTSFLHVEDAAHAALLALNWPSGPVNIVDDEPAKGTDWLPVYADALRAPLPDRQPGSNRGERGASNAKARKEYGWEPMYPTWRTGFAKSLT